MRKYVYKLLFFFSPFIVFFFVFEIIIGDYTLSALSPVYKKVNDYLAIKKGNKILVFGNSHADNAIVESFSPYVFNLSNQGQDIKHDLFLLNLLKNDIKNVTLIVLTFSYFSFEYSEEKIWPYRVKDYFDAKSIKPENNPINFKNWLFDNSKLINHNVSIFQIVKHYYRKIATKEEMKYSKKQSVEDDELLIDAKNRAIPVHLKYYNSPHETIMNYLDELINIVSDKNVIAVIPPYHHYYNKFFPKERLRSFYLTISYIKENYNIKVLNYSKDSRFTGKNNLFLNSDHLNIVGASKFTQILLNDLHRMLKNKHQCL